MINSNTKSYLRLYLYIFSYHQLQFEAQPTKTFNPQAGIPNSDMAIDDISFLHCSPVNIFNNNATCKYRSLLYFSGSVIEFSDFISCL